LEAVQRHRDNPQKVDRFLDVALDAADRAAKLTQQLLAFSRRQVLQPEVADVNRLIEEFLSLMRRAAGEAVDVRTVLSARRARCEIDPSQFEAAILNLVVNARDALPNGGEITIATSTVVIGNAGEATLAPGAYVRLTISDTGEGMRPEVLERAFEPFFTTKEVGKGTGLGLSMVYGFVQQSGGEIRIASELGAGTHITIFLPVTDNDEIDRPASFDSGNSTGGTERILLVEDNSAVRVMATTILSELGYDVVTAPNARQALDILRDDPSIDLLFTDVVMPGGVSGLELAHEARRLRPRLRVLATSGDTGGHLDLNNVRTVTILSKPYHRAELARSIRSTLDRGSADATLPDGATAATRTS
jgi:CheY-like chemotaxis protein